MNKEKLKLKYILGSYKDDPNYPTTEDIMFEIIKFANSDFINESDLNKICNDFDVSLLSEFLQEENNGYKIIKNPFV